MIIRIITLCMFMFMINNHSFQTRCAMAQNSETPEFVFGVVADVQYRDADPESNRYFRQALEKLSEAVKDFNSRELAFVIQLGDIIDRDFVSFEKVLAVYKQLDAPAYHVPGNHDFLVKPEKKKKVLEALGLERGYYDFSHNSWRFIVLDGNELSLYAVPKASKQYAEAEKLLSRMQEQGLPNAQTWNGGLSKQQHVWLQESLEQALEKQENVVIFCHFPVFPPDRHNLWNDVEVLSLIEKYPNVVAYMNGHNHAGNYAKNQGIHYLNFQGMVDTSDTNAYAIVEVYADYLKIVGQGREAERVLFYEIK